MTFTFVYTQNIIFYVIVFKNTNIAHIDFELFRFRLFFFLSTFTFGFSKGISNTKSILFLEGSADGTADVYVTTKWS